MSFAELMQCVQDRTIDQFAGIGSISAIVPITDLQSIAASAADFDILAAVANHIYFIETVYVAEISGITGAPQIVFYDDAAVAVKLFAPNIGNQVNKSNANVWTTRIEHLQGGGSAGSYTINYIGFDLTWVAP